MVSRDTTHARRRGSRSLLLLLALALLPLSAVPARADDCVL